MKPHAILCASFALTILVGSFASAQPGAEPFRLLEDIDAVGKDQPKQKDKDKDKDKDKKLTDPPETTLLTPAPARSDFQTYFNPNMMGDWQNLYARQLRVIAGAQATTTTRINSPTATLTTGPSAQARTVLIPVPTRGSFKIADNESPRPQDRVFFTWNHYNGLGFGDSGPNAPQGFYNETNQVVTFRGGTRVIGTTTVATEIPGASRVNLNRETFGFEKTFLDGYASIGLRAPLHQQGDGNAGAGASNFGDLTIILKYALILDQNTGNVLSTGIAITTPNGPAIPTTEGNFRDVLLQPYVGYIWNASDRFFLQGFHSIVVPTDSNDVTLLFNDLGVGFWLYRGNPDRAFSFIVPTVEAHVTTPLNHRNFDGPIVVPDSLVMTAGVHIGMFRNGTLSLGAATPVTGPRPYTIETFVQFNWRF